MVVSFRFFLTLNPDDGSKPTPTMETHIIPDGEEIIAPTLREKQLPTNKQNISSIRKPEKLPSCDQERQSALEEARQNPREGIFVPDCGPHGLFKSVQCHQSTGYCWCVQVDTGRPIPGTSTRFTEPDPSHTLEERVVQWYFFHLDNNGSHDISKKELKPFKRFLKKKAKPRKCARKFTEYCDLNKDKAISLQELKGCLGVNKEGDYYWLINRKSLEWRQLTTTLLTSVVAAVFGSLQVGYHTGNVNSPAGIIEEFFNLTWKSRHNQPIPVHSLTFLWALTVSIKDFGALLGSLGVKNLADAYGRRNAILIANTLSIAGSFLMFLSKAAESFELLIVGRFIFGLFCGLVMSLNPLYIQAVSPINLRGAFATVNQVSFASGIFLGMVVSLDTVLGTKKYWAFMLSLPLIPAVIQCLILPFCPESPRYLFINCGKEAEAEAALNRLRGSPEKVTKEMDEMKEEASHSNARITIWEFFIKRCYRQPIILILVINLGSQLSGFNAIISYSTKIFTEAKYEEAKYLTLGVGAVNVAFTIVSLFLVENAGRRKLLLSGFLLVAFCNLLMTIIESLLDVRGLQVLLVFVLISAYELGPGPISWFIGAELFDQPVRPIAMAFTSMLNWGGKFLLALFFPTLLHVCGAYVYLLFMSMSLIAFIYTMLHLPETKGRALDDIAAEFRRAESIPLYNKTIFNTFT
ncbi:Solute carrier family 2, facilitated glucose transporter member 1 [Bagarius yarrelli]|uniref:Solute carrier family 2, facilitated glucose transporter member 5 n=1 Tax=Bagarius yarrelli TaxID=175774 RepID=A0A556U575_BAGYA|nr:Solute carrier family 2, facilitated glucose transporter member 1 [Bagarius yarrelli]